jgi:hypothetical protein
LRKTRVRAHRRRTRSGRTVGVREHERRLGGEPVEGGELPEGWELFDRKTKEKAGKTYFYDRYVNKGNDSGMIFLSYDDEAGRTVYYVEGYGVGTIDTRTFEEKKGVGMAPIQTYASYDFEDAKRALFRFMRENSGKV